MQSQWKKSSRWKANLHFSHGRVSTYTHTRRYTTMKIRQKDSQRIANGRIFLVVLEVSHMIAQSFPWSSPFLLGVPFRVPSKLHPIPSFSTPYRLILLFFQLSIVSTSRKRKKKEYVTVDDDTSVFFFTIIL